MATFTTKFIKSQAVAQDKMAFYFEKPEGFEYIPGQHASLKLLNPVDTDSEGNERTFSFITIPSDPTIGFTTKMRDSAFKRNLKNMSEGTEIEIRDPRGSMVLPSDAKRPVAFLAGGIGITPFMSMAKQAAHENYPQKVYLFYSNKTREEAAFLDELSALAEQNSNFTFIPTMTQEDVQSGWEGEQGHFTEDLIRKYISDVNNTIFYMAGPAGLVKGVTQVLTALGVESLFVKSEDFGEYK